MQLLIILQACFHSLSVAACLFLYTLHMIVYTGSSCVDTIYLTHYMNVGITFVTLHAELLLDYQEMQPAS